MFENYPLKRYQCRKNRQTMDNELRPLACAGNSSKERDKKQKGREIPIEIRLIPTSTTTLYEQYYLNTDQRNIVPESTTQTKTRIIHQYNLI